MMLRRIFRHYGDRGLHIPVSMVLGMIASNVVLNSGNHLRWYIPLLMVVMLTTTVLNAALNHRNKHG